MHDVCYYRLSGVQFMKCMMFVIKYFRCTIYFTMFYNRFTDVQLMKYTMQITKRKHNAAPTMVVNLCLLTISKNISHYQLQQVQARSLGFCRGEGGGVISSTTMYIKF